MVNADNVASTPRDHGDNTAGNIDREVDRLIQEGLEQAMKILKENEPVVRELTETLLEKQKLTGVEIRQALGLPPIKEPAPTKGASNEASS